MTSALKVLEYARSRGAEQLTLDEIQSGVPLAVEDQMTAIKGPSFPKLDHASLLATELVSIARFVRGLQTVYPQRNVTSSFEDRMASIIQFAMASKLQFQTALGLDALEGGLMLQPMDPYVAFANSGAVVSTWAKTAAAAGWTAGYWTVNLNHTTSPVTQDMFSALIMGVADFAQSPKITAVQVLDPAGTKYGRQPFPSVGSLEDTQYHFFNENYYLGRNEQSWTVDVNFGVGGNSMPVLLGITAGRKVGATAETA